LQATDERRTLVHALNQPVNVIRLTIANMGTRLLPGLDGDDRSYLVDRLAVIEAQIEHYVAITEAFERGAAAAQPVADRES
jgi:hypothetical protein